MSKKEYRVVWKRLGCARKTKRFQSLKTAERRVLLLGPEPWLAFGKQPDALHCCSGGECACNGVTWREHLLGERAVTLGPNDPGMPGIEYIRIETRPLGEWSQVSASAP